MLSKQELIDDLKDRIAGNEAEIAKLQHDSFNLPTIRWYEGRIHGMGLVVRQLEHELREEVEQPKPGADVLPELPEGCLETGRTIVRSYLTSEGKSEYTIHTRGERSKFDAIGALEVAKHDILQAGWGDE